MDAAAVHRPAAALVFGLTTHDALVLLNQVCVVRSLRLASLCQGQQKCFIASGGTEVGQMLVPAPQPNAYWHMDATRGLVKDVDGRPVYAYLVHVSMQDGVHRLCRSGCAPVLAAAYATTDTTALAVQIFLSRLKAAIQLASGSKHVACTHRLQDCKQ